MQLCVGARQACINHAVIGRKFLGALKFGDSVAVLIQAVQRVPPGKMQAAVIGCSLEREPGTPRPL